VTTETRKKEGVLLSTPTTTQRGETLPAGHREDGGEEESILNKKGLTIIHWEPTFPSCK